MGCTWTQKCREYIDWFRRKKKKIEKPLQAMKQTSMKTKEEVKPRAKEARLEEKTRRTSRKRRTRSLQETVELTRSSIGFGMVWLLINIAVSYKYHKQ